MIGLDRLREFFQNIVERQNKNHPSGRQNNQVYVEGTGFYNNIPVVVTCRPELRSKEEFVAQAVQNLIKKEFVNCQSGDSSRIKSILVDGGNAICDR